MINLQHRYNHQAGREQSREKPLPVILLSTGPCDLVPDFIQLGAILPMTPILLLVIPADSFLDQDKNPFLAQLSYRYHLSTPLRSDLIPTASSGIALSDL